MKIEKKDNKIIIDGESKTIAYFNSEKRPCDFIGFENLDDLLVTGFIFQGIPKASINENFKNEFKLLLAKYNASLIFEVDGDLDGIYDEKVNIVINDVIVSTIKGIEIDKDSIT